jgi:hypothetical protein
MTSPKEEVVDAIIGQVVWWMPWFVNAYEMESM